VSSEEEPQVAWKAIESDAQVFSTEGQAVGKVAEVVGDYDADVFTGLAISHHALGRKHFVEAEHVRGIWADRVELDLTKDEIDRLPEHTAPPVIRVDPGEPGGFFRRLFGR
jgi:sporulation protein YlmC with PRC-barrel domain